MLTILALYSLGATLIIPLVVFHAHQSKRRWLLAKVENAVLSDRYIEVTENHITDWDVDFYLDRQGVSHKWKRISRSHLEDVRGNVKYKDILQTDMCERCGLIRRTWVHGLGAMSYNHLAGYFRGETKFSGTEQTIRCLTPPNIRVLPQEHRPRLQLVGGNLSM